MGNLLTICLNGEGLPDGYTQRNAERSVEGSDPSPMKITGRVPLSSTIQANGMTIDIESDQHEICVTGNGNRIVLGNVSNIKIRLEGSGHQVEGNATDFQIFTDDPTFNCAAIGLRRKVRKLTIEAGNQNEAAPQLLQLVTDTNAPAGRGPLIKYSYKKL